MKRRISGKTKKGPRIEWGKYADDAAHGMAHQAGAIAVSVLWMLLAGALGAYFGINLSR